MTRNLAAKIIWGVTGVAAGIGLWFISVMTSMTFGLLFYSVIGAAFLELTIWIVSALVTHKRLRRQHPKAVKYKIAPLLAGMLIPIAYIVTCEISEYPHAILPG